MLLTKTPSTETNRTSLLAMPVFLVTAGAVEAAPTPAAADEPTPICDELRVAPDELMGYTVAYGVELIERLHRNEMSREDFSQAVTSVRNITRLIGERELDAACMLLGEIEDRYRLQQPDFANDPRYTALYRETQRSQK